MGADIGTLRVTVGMLVLAGCATTAPLARSAGSAAGTGAGAHREPELASVTHTVAPGESLYRIAKAYALSVEELAAANGIQDPRLLRVGQDLVVPGATQRQEVEVPVDGEPTRPRTRVIGGGASEAGGRVAPPPVKAGPVGNPKGTLAWPLRGVLYARFGKKGAEPHDGIDLAAPAGTSVKTAAAGTVLFAGEQPGYGQIVIVEHAGGLITLYAHNRDLRVKTGQKVRDGQVVATVGDSGRTSGPHLHFEVRRDGMPIDPLLHLGPVPAS